MSTPTPSPAAAKEDFRRALQKLESLHGNMAVLSSLGLLLRDTNTGIDDLAKLLQTDGALSANVIRVSNSAIYGFGARIHTVEDALIKVGFNQILNLVGAALSRQVFMKDLPAYNLTADDYWAYSYFCGVLVENQSGRLGQSANDAYLIGLLHSIGRVVINELLLKTKIEVYWDRSIPCEEWETLLIGFRHDEAGARLLQAWKFAPAIWRRIECQKYPQAQAEDPVLLTLDYARACAELNHYRLAEPYWKLPENHPLTLTPGFDLDAMTADVEQAKQVCLQIRSQLIAT